MNGSHISEPGSPFSPGPENTRHGSLSSPCPQVLPRWCSQTQARSLGPWPGPALLGPCVQLSQDLSPDLAAGIARKTSGVRRDLAAVLGPELSAEGRPGAGRRSRSRCLKANPPARGLPSWGLEDLTSAGPGPPDLVVGSFSTQAAHWQAGSLGLTRCCWRDGHACRWQ